LEIALDPTKQQHEHTHEHEHGHDHSHDHGHPHRDDHAPQIVEDDQDNIDGQQLIDALQAVLIKKRILSAGEVTLELQNLESPGTHLGAKLVARAWVDAAFRSRLLQNGKDAASELKIKVGEAQLLVVENTARLHNLIVCTLCSCYPRSILGQPPSWYVSKAYRARAVREPAAVLAEFGLELAADVQIVVHDSNADMRFLVLPERPPNTDGLSEEELSKLVTRDCMIGVAKALDIC
jgi:hypothetical protein